MKILNIIGKVGAVAAAIGGLVLAGKTGFGSDLFSNKETGPDTDDLTGVPIPEQTEDETVEEEVQEEEEETPE